MRQTKTNVYASLCDCLVLWVYSPGHSRMDAVAGPVGVQAEEGDRSHTAVPVPEDSSDTVLGQFGRDLQQ